MVAETSSVGTTESARLLHQSIYQPLHYSATRLFKYSTTSNSDIARRLAKFFLDVRGNGNIRGSEYNQSQKPVTDQHEAVGHAVRAAYMYTGMADVAALSDARRRRKGVQALLPPALALLIDALEQAYLHNGRHPGIGSPRYGHELNLPGLRSWALKRYPHLVFYVERSDHIDVWRVLHGRRDIPALMREPEA